MKRLFLCVLAVVLMLAGKLENGTTQKGEVIGFWGDSITHAEYSEINYTHVLYNYYVTHMPEEEIELRNLGVGGAKVPHGLMLYKKDPAAAGLDKVVLEYGINDLKKYFYEDADIYEESQEARAVNLEEYRENLNTFFEMLEKDGIEGEEICTATLTVPDVIYPGESIQYPKESQALTHKGFEKISEISRELSKEQGLGLFEFQEPLTELAEVLPKDDPEQGIMQEDLLHLNTNGQIYLAYLFLEQQGALRDISRVEIQKGRIYSEDSDVSNLHYKDGYLYYDYRANRMPMGISYEYREADEVLHILDKLNREIIQVQDLQEDALYDIYMSGRFIGSYTGADFATGVNIANIKESPVQDYAKVIEEMNRGRRAAELVYRKKVQDFTDCGSGNVTEEELLEAYDAWRKEDATYRQSMYELAQDEIQITQRIAIVRQGVKAPKAAFMVPGRDYGKAALVLAAIFGILILGIMFYKTYRLRKGA